MVVTLRTVKKKKVRKMKTMNKNHRLDSTPIDILQNVRPSKSVTVRLPAPPHLSGIFFCSPSNSFFFCLFLYLLILRNRFSHVLFQNITNVCLFIRNKLKKRLLCFFPPPKKKKKKKKKS